MSAQIVINEIRNQFKILPGVIGVVLGGARARGMYRPESDIEIGVYYDEEQGFDINKIQDAVAKMDDENRKDLITNLKEWGHWINGGGKFKVKDYQVDLTFRDINQVIKAIDDCLKGDITIHYQQGHPHGFSNIMYMGELSICRILVDSDNKISNLNSKTFPYPKLVKEKLVSDFIFEAEFSLKFAKDNIGNRDLSYVVGHCFRTVSCLNQVIFALNEAYCINEKGAVEMTNNLEVKPEDYRIRVEQVFELLSTDEDETRKGLEILENLFDEVKLLIDEIENDE